MRASMVAACIDTGHRSVSVQYSSQTDVYFIV